ncbi:hypothetical protein J3R30DRAFT_3399977 [Lentinula aciculospora]|uniref:Uncharacterized protein n=1 Tax=Lentinula aciculospora TaxID=153920 RepID=A0A9W9AUA9_9AGAR|nr:hypothetical protein J3R30DRAFT_3399977 [Lentinula aciculospora]
MTVYSEDVVYSEYVEGQVLGTTSGVTSVSWATSTYLTPITMHETIAVGATALQFSDSNATSDQPGFVQPAFVDDCSLNSGETSGIGACTEVYWFSGESSRTTSWTGLVSPFATLVVSASATATSTANAAHSRMNCQSGFLVAIVILSMFAMVPV